jgi:hypothetical protein
MAEQVIAFPELESVLTAHIDDLRAKGADPVILLDETTEPTYGVCSRTVLVVNGPELTSFTELWIEDYGPLGMVTKGSITARAARLFVDYLDKKRFPQQAEGECGR